MESGTPSVRACLSHGLSLAYGRPRVVSQAAEKTDPLVGYRVLGAGVCVSSYDGDDDDEWHSRTTKKVLKKTRYRDPVARPGLA